MRPYAGGLATQANNLNRKRDTTNCAVCVLVPLYLHNRQVVSQSVWSSLLTFARHGWPGRDPCGSSCVQVVQKYYVGSPVQLYWGGH